MGATIRRIVPHGRTGEGSKVFRSGVSGIRFTVGGMGEHMLVNPVLRGCEPDPSILRVGADYYLATSTFEWFPGVRLHHSRDLVNWRLAGHLLTEDRHLDLRGVADSSGVWAPSLSFHDGLFWLVYTVVRRADGKHLDLDNYLITAPSIDGPWSDRIYLNSSGFDPSLFHDADGRRWLVNVSWDFRPGRPNFAGILLQEYDHQRRRLVGAARTLLTRGAAGDALVEGPNLYRRGGWYYLMLAEGGTGWNHGISMARARAITGPYELDPTPAILTTRDDPGGPLQKAGHGELVETESGDWFLAHLASRPTVTPDGQRFCMLGRETCLQPVEWTADGWLRLASGATTPATEVRIPGATPQPPRTTVRDDFDQPRLDAEWSSLRQAADPDWADLAARPGWVRLRGRESVESRFEQSLLARRLTEPVAVASTGLDFRPTHYSQQAGLVFWYDTGTHYYLRVTDTDGRRTIGLVARDEGRPEEFADSDLDCADWPLVHLRLTVQDAVARFFASPDGVNWQSVGPAVDATRISDDYGGALRFTGAFVGICAQDLANHAAVADFDYFELTVDRRD